MTRSKVHLNLDSASIACTPEEIAETFAGLLREMRDAAPLLTTEERAALRHIMANDPGALTVADVFPDFARGSGSHLMLRRLRTAQFIRPAGRDMWDRESHIDIKPFARLMWDRLGEAALFGEVPEGEDAEADDEVDLSRPDVNEDDAMETVRVQDKNAWEDDDLLDFLKDDTRD